MIRNGKFKPISFIDKQPFFARTKTNSFPDDFFL